MASSVWTQQFSSRQSTGQEDMRVREWGKCGLGCRTIPGGCKQPCSIVLPVLVKRCHYCVSAHQPMVYWAADPPHPSPHAFSAILCISSHSLRLVLSLSPRITVITTSVVKLALSRETSSSLKHGCKDKNEAHERQPRQHYRPLLSASDYSSETEKKKVPIFTILFACLIRGQDDPNRRVVVISQWMHIFTKPIHNLIILSSGQNTK